MQIIVTTNDGCVHPLDVSDELPLSDLKAVLESEVGILAEEMLVIHNMVQLRNNNKMLKEFGINEGDVLLVMKLKPPQQQSQSHTNPQSRASTSTGGSQLPAIDWSSIQIPSSSRTLEASVPVARQPQSSPQQPREDNSIESVVQHFLSNPDELRSLQQTDSELAQAIVNGDYNSIGQALARHRQQKMDEEKQRQELAGLDPMSQEYQQKLAEHIRRKNIQENMETALEYNPEIFMGRVHMLYISCKVNGNIVKALVDTGAQMTVMNVQCAQRCDIMRLLDRRYASYAFGVGRQRILGIIHLGQIQIGEDFLASSFRVLEDQSHELILGLDMLKRHQCCVDLSKDMLIVGTTSRQTKFLSEGEVPQAAFQKEEKGVIEDEDHEMASAIANSEAEYKEKNGKFPPPG